MEINFGDPLVQVIALILTLAIVGGVLRFIIKATAKVISLGCSLIFIAGLIIILQLVGN